MGKGFLNTIRVIVLPLIYTNILVGGILVFVELLFGSQDDDDDDEGGGVMTPVYQGA